MKRLLIFFVIGLLYGIILNSLALLGMGAGHGTIMFYKFAAAPIAFLGSGIGLILSPVYWGTAFSLAASARRGAKLCGRGLLVVSCFTAIMWYIVGDVAPVLDTFQKFVALGFGQIITAIFVLVYVTGQFFAWFSGRERTTSPSLRT